MKQLEDLLNWLDSFEKLPFEPTRQNVVEKIWQLQSEVGREQFAIDKFVKSQLIKIKKDESTQQP